VSVALAKVAPRTGALELIERTPREPGEGEVAVRVSAVGICGTDLAIEQWPPWMDATMGHALPVVIGHEFTGVVDAVGRGVDPRLEGARVAIESHAACGSCRLCARGDGHLCADTRYVGFHFDGGFAQRAVVPTTVVRPVPDGVDELGAALLEPFGLAVRSVEHGEGVTGRHVVITGAGPLGIMAALVARVRGAASITLTESDDERRALAAKAAAGARLDALLDADPASLAQAVEDLTGGDGMDVWIDMAGVQATMDAGVGALARGGEGRLMGLGVERISFDLVRAVQWELRLQPLHGRLLEETWESSIALLASGAVKLDSVVTAQLDLDRFDEAFAMVRERRGLKVVLRPPRP
jgi:threonine 3-dehydrogenase